MGDARKLVQPMSLKPCPFCGGPVQMKHHGGDYGYIPPSVNIRCDGCGCGFRADTEKWEQGRGHYDVTAEAEATVTLRWNTRS